MLSPLVVIACLGASEAPAPLAAYARSAQGKQAYGLYIKGKKAGWSVDEVKVVEKDGKERLRLHSTMLLDTLFDGVRSKKESRTTVEYSLEGVGRIEYARHWKNDDGIVIVREAVANGKTMMITTTQGKNKSTREVPIPKDTLEGQRSLELWLKEKRKPGDVKEKYTASWEEADVDVKEAYTFRSRKVIALGGVKTELLSVESKSEGASITADVFPDGRIYKAQLGGFLEIRLEPEESARKLDGALVDLLDATSIVLDKDLGASGEEIDELVLEVSGADKLKIPVSRRQSVEAGKESLKVTLTRDRATDAAEPLSAEEVKALTAATPRLCHEDRKIQALAKKIAARAKDKGHAARLIADWVHANLRKSYSDNADNALDVLERKAGACVQHSMLFVSLARAAGIPAREVGGLAYLKAGKPRLGWHAWAEYHDGKQWVSVDPTWGQQRVDGTHLKLSEGDRDMAWSNVVGSLRVKVLSYKASE
jgi:hypothetical protein